MIDAQEKLDAIEAAICTGATTVRTATDTVIFRSLDEMLQVRDMLRETVQGQTSGVRAYPRYQVANFRD